MTQPDSPSAYAVSDDDLVRVNRSMLVAAVVRGTVHSVNNLLQTIGGQAELLGMKPEPADDVRRRAERISAQTVKAAAYMRELSALVREVPGAVDRVDVRSCVARVVALREYDQQRARIAFEARYAAGELPQAAISLASLTTILLNLVLNAEQALVAAQTSDARIDLQADPADGQVRITVSDNGPGLAAGQVDRAFDAFRGAAPGGGLGLGLWVSRHLARRGGGDLVLAPGGPGARLVLTIPAVSGG